MRFTDALLVNAYVNEAAQRRVADRDRSPPPRAAPRAGPPAGRGRAPPRRLARVSVPPREGKARRAAAAPLQGARALRRDDGGVHGEPCLLYTSDAADERSSVDLGG